MQRLRSTWLALVGGALLLAFSVPAALGAPPTEGDGSRGRSISAFVHELIFGIEDQTDEDAVVDEDQEEEDSEDEDSDENDDAGLEGEDESDERQVPEEFANHGECVSEAVHDQEGFEASEAKNRGEWVSTHARYVCWGLEPPDEETEETDVELTDPESDEEGDSDNAVAKEERKAAKAAAKAERKAAQAAAKSERQAANAERQAAKAERKAGRDR